MAVDLTKNKQEMEKVWKDIFDDNCDTQWAVFGYEGKTNTLKVVETGDGDLEEMVEELNDGKIMYACCRVMDPNTNLPKYVFINWQGEGVPATRKGACARHVRDVEGFFRGAHVSINARCEDDVETNEIIEKVKKSSGANYSFHKEKARPVEAPTPVGSVYQRQRETLSKDIDLKKRDQYWASVEQEEKARVYAERSKKSDELKEMERKRKEREAKEADKRDAQYRERAKSIEEQRTKSRKDEEAKKAAEKAQWETQKASEAEEMEREKQRKDAEMKARVREAESLVQQRKEQQKKGPVPAPPGRTKPAVSAPEPEPEPARAQPKPLPTRPEPVPEPEPARAQPKPLPTRPEPVPEPEPEPARAQPKPLPTRPEPEPEPEPEPAPAQPKPLPSRPEPEPEPAYQEEFYENVEQPGPASAGYHDAPLEEPEYPPEDQGLTVRALYDYQAEDDTEITFDPDDLITNVEQVDPGWWRGTAPDGTHGLFPANFVEILS